MTALFAVPWSSRAGALASVAAVLLAVVCVTRARASRRRGPSFHALGGKAPVTVPSAPPGAGGYGEGHVRLVAARVPHDVAG